MKKWLKRIRGAVGTALTWAVVWGGVGTIYGLLILAISGGGPGVLVGNALALAMIGFVGGAIFSTVLGITEGRRRFDEMSLPRFAAWGAVGGLLLSVLLIADGAAGGATAGIFYGVLPLLAAGSAAGSLALARRADDRELLEHGADVADIGLTEEERRELLAG